MNADQILKRHREAGGPTLLVDDIPSVPPEIPRLAIDPTDLWMGDHGISSIKTAVVSKPRTARDLYRVLSLLERLITSEGSILIAPYATEAGPENRFEATEVFLGAHSMWERKIVFGNTVELKKLLSQPPGGRSLIREQALTTTPTRTTFPPPAAHKRVVSLAVFGEPRYWRYVGTYVRAHHALFHSYELHLHHDEDILNVPYGRALRTMAAKGIMTLRQMPSRPNMGKCEKMLWRIAPAWDPEVEYVFARDLDAGTSWRDRCAIEEFIATGLDAHALYDNSAHIGLMGGMCGYRAAKLRELFGHSYTDFIATAGYTDEQWNKHGADQDFMNSRIWPATRIFEQRAFAQNGDKKAPSPGVAMYADKIADPGPLDVSVSSRFNSDKLIGYIGVAGYDLQPAIDFYSSPGACSIIDQIEEAEADAGVGPDGAPR